MQDSINRSLTRRGFLKGAAAAGGVSVLSGTFGNPFPSLAHLSVEQVKQIHEELVVKGRRLDLSVVLYSNQLHPAIKRHLDIVDVVYFWTWRARDLENLEGNFAAYRKIVPTKRTRLGIYMWDFGEGKPIPLRLMEHQCRLGLQWLKKGEIEGMIFHCTPLCDMKLEAVEWSKNWIARHADEVVGT